MKNFSQQEGGADPLKINEVESLVGITKKNIRFYEEKGLLSPRRNSENGYRDYGEEEVAVLRRIKPLRRSAGCRRGSRPWGTACAATW